MSATIDGMGMPGVCRDLHQEWFKNVLPPLDANSHKGQNGRIGVVGGCKEYTGAPYFAAISALKVGCDLSHVFCTAEAAPVIKAYSPELIVHPLLGTASALPEIENWMERLHSCVIGPGLGRDPEVLQAAEEIILKAKTMNLPIVIDADGLHLITENPGLIASYQKAVLTPNVIEFSRLYKTLSGSDFNGDFSTEIVSNIAKTLGNVTIVLKGKTDIISDGIKVLQCQTVGSPRRCGGQGDLLSGSLGAFNFWCNRQAASQMANELQLAPAETDYSAPMMAAFAACHLTRICNNLAFRKYHRSTMTSNMIQEIHHALEGYFE